MEKFFNSCNRKVLFSPKRRILPATVKKEVSVCITYFRSFLYVVRDSPVSRDMTSVVLKLGQRFVNFEIYVFASLIPAKGDGASATDFRRSDGLLQRSQPLQVEIYRPFLWPTAAAIPQNTTKACYKINVPRKEEEIAHSFLKVLVI